MSDYDKPAVHVLRIGSKGSHKVRLSDWGLNVIETALFQWAHESGDPIQKAECLDLLDFIKNVRRHVDTASSASRQHYIDTGRYLTHEEVAEWSGIDTDSGSDNG